MGPEFFQTMMGRKFYEHDVPELIKAFNRLSEAIEESNALMKKSSAPSAPESDN